MIYSLRTMFSIMYYLYMAEREKVEEERMVGGDRSG